MATTDGQNPKRIGLAVLVIAGVALLQHGASSGYVRGPGAVGSKKADHRQNSPSPAGIPLRVLTLGLSTRAEACDAPVPSGAELLLAEECGRVHADVTLGLRLFAEADGAGRVVIKNCGGAHGGADEGACDHLTLWGRVVANTAIAGARSTIAGVDVVPAAGRRCEWGVTLPLITDKTAELELVYSWNNGDVLGRQMGARSGECTVDSDTRYTGTEFTTRQGNPQLGVGPAVAHPELYANFGRQTRWLDCCTFCELHSRCWHWTVRQPKRDRGKLTSGRCTMYTENVSSTATSPDDESSYVSGTVARPAGRSKYLGGLSAHRADTGNATCRQASFLAGFPARLSSAPSGEAALANPADLPVCTGAGPDVNARGQWRRLAAPDVAECARRRVYRNGSGALEGNHESVSFGTDRCTYPDRLCVVTPGPHNLTECSFSNWGQKAYFGKIDAPPEVMLAWRPPSCRYEVFARDRLARLLTTAGVTDIVLMGGAHLAWDLHVRYGFEISPSPKSPEPCNLHDADGGPAMPCLHVMPSPVLSEVAGRLAAYTAALAKVARSGRAVFVLSPPAMGAVGMPLIKGTPTMRAFKQQAAAMAQAVADAQASGAVSMQAMLVWDSGPALHEYVFDLYDTQPLRAALNHAMSAALLPKGWHLLDSMSPTASRPDYRAYWYQGCEHGYSCQGGVTLLLSTMLLHIMSFGHRPPAPVGAWGSNKF